MLNEEKILFVNQMALKKKVKGQKKVNLFISPLM